MKTPTHIIRSATAIFGLFNSAGEANAALINASPKPSEVLVVEPIQAINLLGFSNDIAREKLRVCPDTGKIANSNRLPFWGAKVV
jgi:hypothetical protein